METTIYIGGRGSGKTKQLMLAAKENNAIFVCSNPAAMAEKARAYGIVGLNFMSYADAVGETRDCFIDDLDRYVNEQLNLKGYSLTIDKEN